MKRLPLKLAKHHLLIQAFTGDDGKFTTEMVWFYDASLLKTRIGESSRVYGNHYAQVVCVAPALDLEELLDLAEKVLGLDQEVPKFPQTDAEVWASDIFHNIGYSGDRLIRIAKAIIAVLEERQ